MAQTEVTTDPHVNGPAIRAAMRRAAGQGARLVHFGEGSLSGYAGADKPHYTGWQIDWAPVTEQLRATMALAGELGVWVVVGGNHRLSGAHRPHNSLWVNGLWVSIAVPAQCAPASPSAVAGPHGYLLRQARADGPDLICVDLDRADPELDVALKKARPWRATARAGDVYAAARVTDPRSADRTGA